MFVDFDWPAACEFINVLDENVKKQQNVKLILRLKLQN
jgi:hypothetical protein